MSNDQIERLADAVADRLSSSPVAAQQLLSFELTEVFQVGHGAESERQFGWVVGMAISTEGHLLALDALERAVTVWDASGNEVHHYGQEGGGPGEYRNPSSIAVSDDLTVAVVDGNRLTLLELDGEVVEARSILPQNGLSVVFDAEGQATVLAMNIITRNMTLVKPPARRSLWGQPAPSMTMAFRPRIILARLPGGNAVVGASTEYRLPVVNLATGAVVGELARDVPVREITSGFAERMKRYIVSPRSAPDGWTSIIGTRTEGLPAAVVESVDLSGPFFVIVHVFTGPPGESIWVRRGPGVGDELAPPIEPPDQPPLWDIFDARSFEFRGTVGMPEGFVPYAGDSERLAGVQTDELGVQAARVFRLRGG